LDQTNFFWIDLATTEGVFMIPPMLHPREMVELLIAAHGLDGALYQACERFNALNNADDAAGAHEWSVVASTIWQVIEAWTEAAEASGVMH
jgi:hypothetical protein